MAYPSYPPPRLSLSLSLTHHRSIFFILSLSLSPCLSSSIPPFSLSLSLSSSPSSSPPLYYLINYFIFIFIFFFCLFWAPHSPGPLTARAPHSPGPRESPGFPALSANQVRPLHYCLMYLMLLNDRLVAPAPRAKISVHVRRGK